MSDAGAREDLQEKALFEIPAGTQITPEYLFARFSQTIIDLRADLAAVTEERDRMKEAIKLISGQPLSSELDAEAQDNADYKGAYDSCIKAARAAIEGVTEPAKGESNG